MTHLWRELATIRYSADLVADTIAPEKPEPALPGVESLLFNFRQRVGSRRVRVNHSLYTYWRHAEQRLVWLVRRGIPECRGAPLQKNQIRKTSDSAR